MMGDGHEDTAMVRKMKKMEKSKNVDNREYLDMDTDEEEFGVQETPEPEEELEVEPEKPIFTPEQINALVLGIKDLTTLPSLTDADWSREVVEIVEEYFRNPAITVLAIFWESKTLKALLEFPNIIVGGLSYFLRVPWQVYTPENFLSNVVFGSVGDGIDNSILSFMENMYAPVAFHSDEWPAVVRNELFSSFHEFLMCLTDVTYDPMGLTMLYVPREGLKSFVKPLSIENERESSKTVETCTGEHRKEDEEALLERLERVARCWIKQIRAAIKGTFTCGPSSSWKTIVDEIRYWHYRYENLNCLYRQLSSDSSSVIVEKLTSVRSASVEHYNRLHAEVREKLNEAASNINYLNLLEKFVMNFDIPDGVENYTIQLLLIIKFVTAESPFYNGYEKILILCRAFCVQTVEHFCKFIDFNVILDGDAQTGKTILVKCIEGCNVLSKTYDRLIDMDRSGSSPTISLVEKSKVFNYVDTFVNRCNDLMTIVDARIAFEKSTESIEIIGPKGFELGLRYRNIEKSFESLMREIKNVRDIILDIVSDSWLDRVVEFKKRLEDIDNMMKNWIEDLFDDVVNVEDGVEALHGIAKFSRRSYLRETLNMKWIQIWKIFANELDIRSTETKENSMSHYPSLSGFCGRANILRGNAIYLKKQYEMLIDASDWFGDCDVQPTVTQKYKRVLAAINEKENALFLEWQKEIAYEKIKNISVPSNESIVKYDDNAKIRTISVNTTTFHVNRLREIGEWNLLDYEAKNIFSKDCPKWNEMQLRYNKIDYLCKFYNNVVAESNRLESFVFSSIFNELEEALNSGFDKTNCFNDLFEIYFKRCLEIIVRIRESFDSYRSIDSKIDYLIEKIGSTNLSSTDLNSLLMLENCDNNSEHERCHGVELLEKNLKLIFKHLLELKNIINRDDEQTSKHWIEYIKEIQEKLKNGFINSIRLSLRCILNRICDGESSMQIRATPLNLEKAKKSFARINATIFERALTSIEGFDKLFETGSNDGRKILLLAVDQDSRSNDIRKCINEALEITE